MNNAQEWLDKRYPKEERKTITELNVASNNLEGNLDLTDFINLEELDCSLNLLTSLKLNPDVILKKVTCDEELCEISLLELKIKQEKEKILTLLLEEDKELLEELIINQLNFTKFKKQESNHENYDEKWEEYEEHIINLKRKFRNKLCKENMNKIAIILNNVEKIAENQCKNNNEEFLKNLKTEEKFILNTVSYNKNYEKKVSALEININFVNTQSQIETN